MNVPARPETGSRLPLLVFGGLLLLVAGVVLGAGAAAVGPWVVAGVLAAGFAVVFLLSSGRALFLTVFVAKPFIDMLWFAKFGPESATLNAQSLVSIAVLMVALIIIVLRRVQLPSGLFVPMAAFVLVNAVAVMLTPSLPEGANVFLRIVCGFPLVFVVPVIMDELPGPRRLLQLFMVVIAAVYVTILLQPLGIIPYRSFEDSGLSRATGFYYHPWDVARYLVIAMPLLLALLEERATRGAERWAYRLLLAATLVVTYVTFLKAAWIVVLLEIVVFYWLVGKHRRALLVFAVIALVVAFPARQATFQTFSDLAKLGDPQHRGEALSGRVSLWSAEWASLEAANPLELLIGQGLSPTVLQETGAAPHNDFLRIVIMNGIIGLLAYASLILAALHMLRKAVRRLARRRGIEWRIGVAVQCLFLAYLAMGLTADPSSYPSITLYLWLLLGLVVGYARQRTSAEAALITDTPGVQLMP
jgi:O-antigen ligase